MVRVSSDGVSNFVYTHESTDYVGVSGAHVSGDTVTLVGSQAGLIGYYSLLLESGDDLLLETGSKILMEAFQPSVFSLISESGDAVLLESGNKMLME